MDLLVVLRTCDRQDVHPERGPRFIDCTKQELIKRCFLSLLKSICNAKHLANIDLHIIDDGSSEETIKFLTKNALDYNENCSIETLDTSGFNASALRQFEVCRDRTKQWVYCVEDDYLHHPEAITQMLLMAERFQQITGQSTVAIRPDDCPFTYSANNPNARKPTLLLLGEDRHWRTQHAAHNTIFSTADLFRDYWHLFASLASYYKKVAVDEDKTINLIWDRVPLFSPIPGLAIHISQNNKPPFTDYNTLWESLAQ